MKTLILLSILCLAVVSCNQGSNFSVPSSTSVSRITAELYNRPDSGKDVPTFTVPKKYHQDFLNAFANAEYDSSPAKWQILGKINIDHSSKSLKVSLFWTGGEKGAFKANGVYYRGGSDDAFIKLITDAKNNP